MSRALALVVLLLSSPAIAVAQTPTPLPAAPAPVTPPAAPPTPQAVPPTPQSASSPTIEDGATVQLEYTLSDDAGKLLDTNKGQQPLTYTQGGQQIIAGLEKQLAGMQSGQAKKVVLKPEDAFGPVDPAAQTEVPKDALPPDALVVGTQLMARNSSGEGRPVIVKEIKEKTVVVDLNHPLAGKTLVFDIKVLGVEPPSRSDAPKSEATTPSK
jgi:FKBP-type peptidyl-prolyl cis-trans isomerase SlyD